MYAKITKEYDPVVGVGLATRVGRTWGTYPARNVKLVKVRLLDDDRIPYYEATATDDEALEILMDWAMRDAGCTILQVKRGICWRNRIWEDVIS